MWQADITAWQLASGEGRRDPQPESMTHSRLFLGLWTAYRRVKAPETVVQSFPQSGLELPRPCRRPLLGQTNGAVFTALNPPWARFSARVRARAPRRSSSRTHGPYHPARPAGKVGAPAPDAPSATWQSKPPAPRRSESFQSQLDAFAHYYKPHPPATAPGPSTAAPPRYRPIAKRQKARPAGASAGHVLPRCAPGQGRRHRQGQPALWQPAFTKIAGIGRAHKGRPVQAS